MRIAVVVGEPSGDQLAADLLTSLKKKIPDLTIEGVLGPHCLALGGKALGDMERLSVLGFIRAAKTLTRALLTPQKTDCSLEKKSPGFVFGGRCAGF